MKVLYLTPGVFDKGGIARYNRYQIRALREAYGESSVRVLSLMGQRYDDLEEAFHVDFAGAMPLSWASRALFVAETTRMARSFRPDLVVCALVSLGPLAYVAARGVGAVLVQNVYGRELWCESGISWPRRLALRGSNHVVADCHSTAERAVELDLRATKPDVVWDCVDTTRYSPGRANWARLKQYGLLDNGRFRVLFLGRIRHDSRYKGFERMLELVARLPDRVDAVVAGKGDYLSEIPRRAAELGIAARTIVTGPIHEADMPDVYRAADAFYLVSEVGPGKGEGIPLTPMEAMACGVPALVGNQDGSRELLDGDGGWCGAPGDIEGQRSYVELLMSGPETHAHHRRAAHLRAASSFDYPRFAAETVAAIECAVGNESKRHAEHGSKRS